MNDLHIRRDRNAGRITLTRPQALNALTHDMASAVHAALDDWRDDPAVKLVILDAEGDRAFCAGGDIAAVYHGGRAGDHGIGRRFFSDEYRMNAAIADYPKPIIAFMQGFVMGGGVGLGGHASHRVVGDTTHEPNKPNSSALRATKIISRLGSKQFAEDNIFNLKNSEVINFDMVGISGLPITFMQGVDFKDKDSELLKSLEEICKENNTSYEVVYQDSSDHASFNKLGIDSVSFCHSDLSKIHTPYDTTTYISTDAIDSVYEIVNEKIMNSCYNNFTLLLYNKLLILVLSIILGVLVGYPLLKKKTK